MDNTGSICLMAVADNKTPQHRLRGLVLWRLEHPRRLIIHRLAGPDACLDGELPFGADRLAVFLAVDRWHKPELLWPRACLRRSARDLGQIEEWIATPL